MKRGFTLIELSIVLVIIGLLVGGILAAQSMVDTSKITSQIRQLQQIDTATQNFVSNYKRWPGDVDLNGYWENNGWDPMLAAPRFYDGETTQIFEELSARMGFPGNYSSAAADPTVGIGKKWPQAILGKSGILGAMNVRFEPFWIIYMPLGRGTNDYCDGPGVNFATPIQALALDTKIDDGNGFTGKIGATSSSGPCLPSSCDMGQAFCGNTKAANPDDYAVTMDGSGNCVDQTTGEYLTNLDTSGCGLQIKANVTKE